MQKARRHPTKGLRLVVSARFQVLLTSLLGLLFTFPSRYCSLSVMDEYLALPDGAGSFPQGFSGPVVLRVPADPGSLRLQGFHLLGRSVPATSTSLSGIVCRPYNPDVAVTTSVWAIPRSLATT
jgi:hypothetical protein